MKAISYAYARGHLGSTIDQVCIKHDPVVVVSRKNDRAVVMVSLEDFQVMEATASLFSPRVRVPTRHKGHRSIHD